ncbi:MAG: tRNA (adenosine(37)-N6)-dimethylallyltransferase MiaA [Proteobacteria bacterium]|nr:tRNA (adenosine(37)-N6)-dimethylallyltransferase MiaA [Pseudomonadota bacterium]
MSPAGEDALYTRALGFTHKDSLKAAVRALERAVKTRVEPARTYARIGRLNITLKRSDEAVRAFRRPIRADRGLVEAHVGLGLAFLDLKNDWKGALPRFRAAVALDSTDAVAQYHLARVYVRAGRQEAKKAADEAWENARIPIFIGGTGLYFKALIQGLVEIPEISGKVRGQLRRRLENEGIKALYQDLEAKDPETAGRLKPADKQRIIRALEVFEATGKSLSRWLRKTTENPFKGVEFVKICLLAGPEILNQRIRARFQNMIKKGAVREAAGFAAKGIDRSRPVMKALGLRPLLRHLKGEISIDQAARLAVIETRQYAKRQRTWFRGQFSDWTFVEADGDAAGKILSLAQQTFRD